MRNLKRPIYDLLTGKVDADADNDIPDSVAKVQPTNFLAHVLALSATKLGDGIADPKIVLPWLLTALGAPAWLLGFLVPLREAGALLPQMLIAERIRALARRKWAWVLGALIQGICISAMGIAALLLNPEEAGLAIIGLLALFALARSICSVSYKDVLGKTVSKATRGTATGTAASIAAGALLIFSAALSLGVIPRTITNVAWCLCFAGGLWIVAGVSFAGLREEASAVTDADATLAALKKQLKLLIRDKQLLRFNLVRALLSATAMAPPFLLAIAGRERVADTGGLGLMLMAASFASLSSAYLWGRLSDRSSRKVLIFSASAGALILAICALVGFHASSFYQHLFFAPALLFALMVAYQGVRLGRSTHIVDMADQDTRASYTALSNTLIGVVLLAGGVFGFLGQQYGAEVVLMIFAAMSFWAGFLACGLEEVQQSIDD